MTHCSRHQAEHGMTCEAAGHKQSLDGTIIPFRGSVVVSAATPPEDRATALAEVKMRLEQACINISAECPDVIFWSVLAGDEEVKSL